MKILLVTEPGMDGVFRYVEALASFLIAQNDEVHLAYSDRRACEALGDLVARIERQGGRTFNLRTGSRPALSDFAALRGLGALVREVRPEIIHSHSSKAGALARILPLLGVGGGAIHVYHPHAYIGMRPRRGPLDIVYDSVERVLARWSITASCSVEENAYAVRRLGIPPSRSPILYTGANTARFAPASPERRRELRARFGLPENARVLGTMGRASAQKDPLTLYRAFAAASNCNSELKLFHVGRGELDDEVNRFIAQRGLSDRVVRLPYLSTPADFYQVVDGFILTSRYEGLSLALLEALSCNLPLILSRAPGNGEFFNLALSHIWSAPIGDVRAFTDAIQNWDETLSASRPVACNHRATAEEQFDQHRCFARVRALYAELIDASRVRQPREFSAYAASKLKPVYTDWDASRAAPEHAAPERA